MPVRYVAEDCAVTAEAQDAAGGTATGSTITDAAGHIYTAAIFCGMVAGAYRPLPLMISSAP